VRRLEAMGSCSSLRGILARLERTPVALVALILVGLASALALVAPAPAVLALKSGTGYDHTAYTYDVPRSLSPVHEAGGDSGSDARRRPAAATRERSVAVSGLSVAANGVGRTGARTCLRSFAGTTLVLMADGTRKPIEDIKIGDKVVATDPETGERVSREVTHVWVHDDQVEDLVIDGEVITTTEDHLFWSVTDRRFEQADELVPGEFVLGDGDHRIAVSGFRLGTERTALAYNLSSPPPCRVPSWWETSRT
jgi:Pretoxin HINT domain